MKHATSRWESLKRAAVPLVCVLAVFYLAFHAVSGERGLLAYAKESRRLEALKAELKEVVAKREALSKKVRGMSSQSLDLDLLDEQARQVLGLAPKGEIVIFLKESASERN
jgi:cell division protein FtsB